MKNLILAVLALAVCFSSPLFSQTLPPSTDDTLVEIHQAGLNGNQLALDVKIQNSVPLAAMDVMLALDKDVVTAIESSPIPQLQPSLLGAVLKTFNSQYDILHLFFIYIYKNDSTFTMGRQLQVNTVPFTTWHVVLTLAEDVQKLEVRDSYALATDSTTAASVVAIDYQGSFLTHVEDNPSIIPTNYALEQNFPNPFNAGTTIRFDLPTDSFVKLDVFNAGGQFVQTLLSGFQSAGSHKVDFAASSLPSGVYFYRLQAGVQKGKTTCNFTYKMVLTK